jgi:urea transport system substrate-binding protein
MVRNYGSRAYFIGSNYVWPQESNLVARRWLEEAGGSVVGEAYMPLGQDRFGPILEDVQQKAPDWIFSTVVGDSDLYFRQQYIKAGFRPDLLPTASLTTSEMEVRIMGTEFGEGHILSAPYFQSLDNPTNHRFVDSFLASPFGESGVTHYNMEETYLSFLFFEKAVEKLVSDVGESRLTPADVRRYSAGLTLSEADSPEGEVMIDPDNFNTWLTPKIGVFNSGGQIDLLYEQDEPIRPEPYVLYPDRGTCRFDGLHLPSGKIVKAAS